MSTPLRERPDAPLGTLIFRAGLLPAEAIESALEEGVKTGKRLGEILTDRGLLKEADLARLLAGQKGLEFVTLREQIVDHAAASLFSEDQARLFRALPYAFEDGVPIVAIADPSDDVLTRNIKEALGREDARFVVSIRSELSEIIGQVYGDDFIPSPPSQPAAGGQETGLEPAPPVADVAHAPESAVHAPASEPAAETSPAPEPAFAQNGSGAPERVELQSPAPLAEPPAPAPAPVPEQAPAAEPEPVFRAAGENVIQPPLQVPAAEPVPEPAPALTPEATPDPDPVPVAHAPSPEVMPSAGTTEADPAPVETAPVAPEPARYRLSVRLTTGERIEAGVHGDLEAAKQQAKALMAQVAAADGGDWPFVSGRFIKPDTIVSVDLL